MEEILKNYFSPGRVVKASGYAGELLLALDVDNPDRYAAISELYFSSGQSLERFTVRSCELNKNATLKFALEGVDTLDQAEEFIGQDAWLPLSFLPSLSGAAFYFHEIEGFSVEDELLGNVGTALGVTELPHQNLLRFEHNGREVLLPILPEFYCGIDRNSRILRVKLPAGLLDIYSGDNREF